MRTLRILRLAKPAFGLAATVTLLCACSGGSQTAIGPSAGMPSNAAHSMMKPGGLGHSSPTVLGSATRPAHHYHGKSWALKGAAVRPSLLYITNAGNATVTFYTYKNGNDLTLQGTLTGFNFPTQPCVDKNGSVFVPDYGNATVTEYAHGGTTPLQTLSGNGLVDPTGCSVDPKTGDLAVANFDGGNVLIYPGATGTPTAYSDANMPIPEYCGYDNNGDLLVSAQNSASNAFQQLGLLPSGGSSFTDLTLVGTIRFPGNVQWGGTYWLVGDQGPNPSYVNQVAISVSTAIITANQALPGSNDTSGFWKRGKPNKATIATADYGNGNAPIFTFPGLSPVNTVTNGVSSPFGAVVSQQGAPQ